MRPLAIVGNGMTRTSAPHANTDYDVWAMNNHPFLWKKRITALFEMHPDVLETNRYTDDYKAWLKQKHDFPIYMHHIHPDIPNSVQFPREDIANFRGGLFQKGDKFIQDFYTSTFPYCLALALHLGYSRIELYGVDLNKEERIQHRDSVFFWLGILQANHVEIVIPADSPLVDEALYPFRYPFQSKP